MPESKRFLLRLDPHLFDALRHWANDELRSINAQIEYLLAEQARRAGRLPKQITPRPRLDAPDDGAAPNEQPSDETGDEPDDRESAGLTRR